MNKFMPSAPMKVGFEGVFESRNKQRNTQGNPFNPFISKTRKYKRGEKPEFKQPFL